MKLLLNKGAAPVPSTSVRQSEIFETKRTKLNNTKKLKTKRKNKLSTAGNNTSNKIDLGNHDYKNVMNSNRIIEPFSPTFEHPEDFLPSNHTSFRTPNVLGESKNVSKNDEIRSDDVPLNKTVQKSSIKGVNMTGKREIRLIKSNHNRTYSSNGDTAEIDRSKIVKDHDMLRETGKFINPLNESADIVLNRSAISKNTAELKTTTTRRKRRPKTGNGRYSRRSKPKTKSEDRKDKKRIFSKSVDQSYHENPSINPHHISKVSNFSPDPTNNAKDDDYLNGTNDINCIKSLVSPTNKINKLIKQSLKRNKEHETLKIIEQILKEEHNLIK